MFSSILVAYLATSSFFFLLICIYLFTYLAALGLSCGMQDPSVAAHGIFTVACGSFSCIMRDLVP